MNGRFSVLRWWQWPTVVLGTVRLWLLGATILPATWRGRDPHPPAEPGSHVYLRHEALMFLEMPLARAAARTEPVRQPRGQLHTVILVLRHVTFGPSGAFR